MSSDTFDCSQLKKDLPDNSPTKDKKKLPSSATSFAACLSNKAGEVREESKRIGRARVKWDNLQSVMIITKPGDASLIGMTRELALWLIHTPRAGQLSALSVFVDEKLLTSAKFKYRKILKFYPDCREQLKFWNPELIATNPRSFDFVITLGGDGTVLFTSWLFQHFVPPVIPFHLGSLGFLTPFNFDHYDRYLVNAMDNGARINLRGRLCCTVYRRIPDHHRDESQLQGTSVKLRNIKRNTVTGKITVGGWCKKDGKKKKVNKFGEVDCLMSDKPVNGLNISDENADTDENDDQPDDLLLDDPSDDDCEEHRRVPCFTTVPVQRYHVINDLVVDRGPSPFVSQLELFGDDKHLTTVQADGLAISTPTGSTAYSLSAGGSLTHPEIHAILITPICPHTLSFRPTLVPDSMELRICVPYNSRSTAWASFDGRGRVELRQGDHIKVTASKYPFPTVCKEDQATDWFNALQNCLHWNKRQRQKSFAVVESNPRSSRSPGTPQRTSLTGSTPNLTMSSVKGSSTSLRSLAQPSTPRRMPYSPSTSSASSENGHDEIFGIFSDDDPYSRASPEDDMFGTDESDLEDGEPFAEDETDPSFNDDLDSPPMDGVQSSRENKDSLDPLTPRRRSAQANQTFQGWSDEEIVRGRLNVEIRRASHRPS
ncbi:ATP-NAD kinase [Hesseltinella vesiculosa]|uniref:ATP-NAD kinase n=1 Tax=Hesseltinella vesiculosa TaxID=101127 RepID=A0A1X2GAW3_9FUNG|nr:ATP-NAD kinase [Hesseltinella vesiculosa]